MWQNTSGKPIWRTVDDTIVDEGAEGAAFLVVGVDGSIPLADAERYGLTGPKAKDETTDAAKAKKDAPANKGKS